MNSVTSKIWILSTSLLWVTACSQVSFTPTKNGANDSQSVGGGGGGSGGGGSGGGGGGGGGSTCSTNLGTTTELTKMLFIVDMSGSNQSAPGCTLGPDCTDPGKKMRAGSIQKFFNDYGMKSNFAWGFEIFHGTGSTPLIMDTAGNPIFSNATAMQSAINTFEGMTDSDNTPYMAALDTATTTIANDPDLHSKNNPQYIVVFMSDGQPDGAGDTASAITSQVQAIVGLLPGKITFNTVYYGTGDATAAGLLQSMSQVGHGNFLNTSVNPTGLDFAIGDLVVVPCP
jgi:hypothetical protein